jgi:hypothetical protein
MSDNDFAKLIDEMARFRLLRCCNCLLHCGNRSLRGSNRLMRCYKRAARGGNRQVRAASVC